MQFKAIVFDFGNVVIDIDVPLTYQAFSKLTGKKTENIEKVFTENQLFYRYETGKFDDFEFREVVRQILGFPLSDREIDLAWNALLLEIPPRRLELIEKLRRKYPIYLLSNTNHIHIFQSENYLKKQFGIKSLRDIFDDIFLSYEIGLWKPETAIYQFMLKKLHLQPEEVLFLDDNVKNVESARSYGINTIQVEPPKCMCEYFEEIEW